MVCVDQKTGEVKTQTLKTLAKYRRNERGRIIFGSHLAGCPTSLLVEMLARGAGKARRKCGSGWKWMLLESARVMFKQASQSFDLSNEK